MSQLKRVTLTAKRVHHCPLNYLVGDQLFLDIPEVSPKSTKVCAYVIQSFLPSLLGMAKEENPPQEMELRCPSANHVIWDVKFSQPATDASKSIPHKMSIVEQDLRRISFFADLPDFKMSKIIDKLVPYRCGPEQILAKQHEEYQALFLIANGVVDILQKNKEGKEVILTKLTRHDYFGEMSLISKEVSSVTIRPATPVTLIVLPKKVFNGILNEDRALKRHFEQYKSEHFPDMQ